MAISTSSFFNVGNPIESIKRERADSQLNASLQMLGLSIIKLTNDIFGFTRNMMISQEREGKNLNEYFTQLRSRSDISSRNIFGIEKKKDEMPGGGLVSDDSQSSLRSASALLAGGGIAGAISSVLSQSEQGADTDTGGSFSGSQNAEKAYNYFVSRGYSPEQSAAIVGNLIQENSALDPKVTNSIGHKGIAQWDPKDRYPKLVQFSKSKGLNPETLEAQLQYVEHELSTGSGGLSKSRLKSVKGLEEATKLVRTQYLRPGEHEAMDQNRLRNAKGVLQKYGGRSTSTAKPSSSSTTKPSSISSSSVEKQESEEHTARQIKVSSSEARPSSSVIASSSIKPPPVSMQSPMQVAMDSSQGKSTVVPISARSSKTTTGSPHSGSVVASINALYLNIPVG